MRTRVTTRQRSLGLRTLAAFTSWAALGLLIGGMARAQSEVAGKTGALYGDVGFENDCSEEHKRFNYEILFHGRVSAGTRAFRECIDQELRSSYGSCDGDPHEGATIDAQIDRLVEVAQSRNDVEIECTGGAGNASAAIGTYGMRGPERFAWGPWFANVLRQTKLGRICTATERDPGPQPDDCRWLDYPWPFSQAADTVWHEVAHQHGYKHGDGDSSASQAARDCGREKEPGWHYQRNTAPYLLGFCVGKIIDDAGSRCGDVRGCPFPNMLNLPVSYGSRTCGCVFDPRGHIATLLARDGRLEAVQVTGGAGGWVGDWNVGTENHVRASGRFTTTRHSQILISSAWGLGVLTLTERERASPTMIPNGRRIEGWVVDTNSQRLSGIGDLTGDGRDDVVITSGWGLGVISLGRGESRVPAMIENGERAGDWVVATGNMSIESVGDVVGDDRAEIFVSSGWGYGLLGVVEGRFTSPEMIPNGRRIGGWVVDSHGQRVRGLGDLTGDGKADIVITSGWGLGVLSAHSGKLESPVMVKNGTRVGDTLIDTNGAFRVYGIADMDADGRDELLVGDGSGIAALERASDGLRQKAFARRGERVDGWVVDPTTQDFQPMGDIDGSSGADILATSSWGVGVLRVADGRFRTSALHRNGAITGGWQVRSADHFFAGSRLTADGHGGFFAFRSDSRARVD